MCRFKNKKLAARANLYITYNFILLGHFYGRILNEIDRDHGKGKL